MSKTTTRFPVLFVNVVFVGVVATMGVVNVVAKVVVGVVVVKFHQAFIPLPSIL